MSQALLKQLTKDALLGTGRADAQTKSADVTPYSPRMRSLVAGLDGQDAAHKLLATAGALAIHETLGQPRTTVADAVDHTAAPEPSKPLGPAEVIALFDQLRRRGETTLQRELLVHIQAKGWRLPSEAMPHLLKMGSKNNLMRPVIISVVDEFGRWLAQKNSAWHYALLPILSWNELNKMWLDSSQQIRLSMMTWLRKTDPAKGLALLEARWPEEPDANKHALLTSLKTGLSMADEPFIERMLDARQMIIHRRAWDLLSQLPDSRFSQRMARFSDIVLTWHPDKNPFVTVRLPVKMTAGLIRDGFKDQFEKRRVDFVTKRLTHLVNCTPLDHWSNKTGLTPHELVGLAQRSNWPRSLLTGLTTAAMRQNRPDWAKAILDVAGVSAKTGQALKVIDPADVGEIVERVLRHPLKDGKLVYSHPLYVLLKEYRRPMPEETVLKTGRLLADYVMSEAVKNVPNASLRGWLTALIANAPPAVAQQFEEMFSFDKDEVHSLWASSIEKGLRQSKARSLMLSVIGDQ